MESGCIVVIGMDIAVLSLHLVDIFFTFMSHFVTICNRELIL